MAWPLSEISYQPLFELFRLYPSPDYAPQSRKDRREVLEIVVFAIKAKLHTVLGKIGAFRTQLFEIACLLSVSASPR